MRRLEAWLDGEHIGAFIQGSDRSVSFEYDDDRAGTPVSLSLPRNGAHAKRAAGRFLENLLPDHEATRQSMASTIGARSTDTFDMLEIAGSDVAGGLVLTPEGTEPELVHAAFIIATERDIARRINSLKVDPDDWVPTDVPARFSLAGTQAKFAIACIDDEWYWSNAGVPSTHIVKPARSDLPDLQEAEVGALRLAREAGIRAPRAEVLHAGEQSAFLIERFDRAPGLDGIPRRLHAEDIAQARGVAPDRKYDVTAAQVFETLRTVDEDDHLAESFVRQLVFNTLITNADAHAKNYSLLLRVDGIEIAPLYDSVPVSLYPEFSQKLAMSIAGAERPQAVSPNHWRKLFTKAGLPVDRMMQAVGEVAAAVAEHVPDAWQDLGTDRRDRLRRTIDRNIASTLGRPTPTTTMPTVGETTRRAKTTAASNAGSFASKRYSPPSAGL